MTDSFWNIRMIVMYRDGRQCNVVKLRRGIFTKALFRKEGGDKFSEAEFGATGVLWNPAECAWYACHDGEQNTRHAI